MAFEKLSDRVRQLIGENDPRAAADLLAQAFRDKNSQLFNIALVQQANIKKLADQSAAGILSADEINREQAKINAALLHLSDEHARLFEGSPIPAAAFPRWVLWAAAALVALVLIGWLARNALSGPDLPQTFDLEVRLHGPDGEQQFITEGQVNVRLGEQTPQELHALDNNGRAVFRDLSAKYQGDSVHLLYVPPKERRFTITRQSAAVLSGRDESIRFTVEFMPDITELAMTLRDSKGKAVAGAQIIIDGTIRSTSDANGYVKVTLPKASGTDALFVIEKNGHRLFEQDLTIWSGHKTFSLE